MTLVGGDDYRCGFCNFDFTSRESLVGHWRAAHNRNPPGDTSDPRDQRIAALEAAVAKAEGERDQWKQNYDGVAEAKSLTQKAWLAANDERDDLRTQLTARDVEGRRLIDTLETVSFLIGADHPGVLDAAEARTRIKRALATAPAAWRK